MDDLHSSVAWCLTDIFSLSCWFGISLHQGVAMSRCVESCFSFSSETPLARTQSFFIIPSWYTTSFCIYNILLQQHENSSLQIQYQLLSSLSYITVYIYIYIYTPSWYTIYIIYIIYCNMSLPCVFSVPKCQVPSSSSPQLGRILPSGSHPRRRRDRTGWSGRENHRKTMGKP